MDYIKEKQEALDAGYRALESLKEARKQISGAKGLGIWDLFAGGNGGIFVSLAKHYKINNARQAIETAKINLYSFNNELKDISLNLNLDIGEFLTLFDIIDNWFADIIVQSKLSDAAKKLDNAIEAVQNVINKIR